MSNSLGRAALLGLAALAWSIAPLATAELGLSGLGDTVAHAKNNKSNNGRHGGGNSNHGNSGNHSNNGHAGDHGNGSAGNVAALNGPEEDWVPPGQEREKNINALAGGLNSLRRDVNGLLNSNDERMAPFRDLVVAHANLVLSLRALEDAQMAYEGYVEGLLSGAGLDPALYGDLSPEGLQAEIDAINDPTDPTSILLEGVLAAVEGSQELAYLDSAGVDVDAAEVGTGDDALIAAIIAGANPNREYTEEELARLVDWAKEILGVGEFDGTIDDLLALWDEIPVEVDGDGDDGGGGDDLPVLL